jgi:hypothetical protein
LVARDLVTAGYRCVARGVHDFETLAPVHYAILFAAHFERRVLARSAVHCVSIALPDAAVHCVSIALSGAAVHCVSFAWPHAAVHCGFAFDDGLCAG